MYVCLCNAVSDHAIRRAVQAGTVSFEQLRFELGVSRSCGRCESHARSVLAAAIAEHGREELPAAPVRVALPHPLPA
jgi:bacterioferritin-associated ferredoxin